MKIKEGLLLIKINIRMRMSYYVKKWEVESGKSEVGRQNGVGSWNSEEVGRPEMKKCHWLLDMGCLILDTRYWKRLPTAYCCSWLLDAWCMIIVIGCWLSFLPTAYCLLPTAYCYCCCWLLDTAWKLILEYSILDIFWFSNHLLLTLRSMSSFTHLMKENLTDMIIPNFMIISRK